MTKKTQRNQNQPLEVDSYGKARPPFSFQIGYISLATLICMALMLGQFGVGILVYNARQAAYSQAKEHSDAVWSLRYDINYLTNLESRLTSQIRNGMETSHTKSAIKDSMNTVNTQMAVLDEITSASLAPITQELKTKTQGLLDEITRTNEIIEHKDEKQTAAQFQKLVTAFADYDQVYNQYREAQAKELKDAKASAHKVIPFVWTLCIGEFIVVLGVITLVGIRLTVKVRRRVGSISNTMRELSQGNTTARAEVTSRDEFGQLATTLNHAQETSQRNFTVIGGSVETLDQNISEVAAAVHAVMEDINELVAQTEVVSGAAGDVSSSIQTVAAGAEEMGASIREISSNANEASRVAQEATETAARTKETVSALAVSSKAIGEVVETIMGISHQTNLLSLNASIEAARAGDAGKGFAVVAGEVKELAGETGSATDVISTKIAAIQEDTNGAVAAIEHIVHIINKINDYQSTIAAAVEKQSTTTSAMSASVAEAATGADSIAKTIGEYVQMTEEVRETTQGIDGATKKMQTIGKVMTDNVSRFQY